MIPLRDVLRSRTAPIVMFIIILANISVFVYELGLSGQALRAFFFRLGAVPILFTHPQAWQIRSIPEQLLPLVSSMFMHGGWLHIISNMWFLYIFGDNVEDRMGHSRFILFYFIAGFVSVSLHIAFNWESQIPVVGASGAIAGVMGAYLIYYPKARIVTLVPIFLFFTILELPAYIFLVFWFLLQFFNGAFALMEAGAGAGIAWWAHTGGFLFGLLFAKLFRRPIPKQAPNIDI